MELFESLKTVFENSDEKILLCDEKMDIVWKNQDNLPDKLDLERIRLYYNKDFSLPVESSETAEYKGEFGESCALKIEPIKQDGAVKGYLMHMYSCDDVEKISDRSGYLKYKSNFLGNIRIEMSKIINMLDKRKYSHEYDGNLDYLRLDKNIRYGIQRTVAATVNYNEMARYYNGFFNTRFINISKVLGEVCEEVSEIFENNGCMFRYDIDDFIFLDMNADRLKTIIMNLLVNAYMYNTKEEKLCELSLKAQDDSIIIKVADNGVGIDEETMSRAVIPFGNFQSFGQRESLGLAITKLFCDYFGGKLEFDVSKGNYTKVKLVFPAPSKDEPHDFKVNEMPAVPNPYDIPDCILAKAFDLSNEMF